MDKKTFTTLHGTFTITKSTDFLSAVKALKTNITDAIYGPSGGILSLDNHNCLVYNSRKDRPGTDGSIYFSADNYLGQWRWLTKKSSYISAKHKSTGEKLDGSLFFLLY